MRQSPNIKKKRTRKNRYIKKLRDVQYAIRIYNSHIIKSSGKKEKR